MWHMKVEYKGEKDVDKVLGLLGVDEKKEMAMYYAERSDAEDTKVNIRNGASSTLIEASRPGYLEVVQSLIGRGADVNKGDSLDGLTPLYMASYHGHLEVVRARLAAGADVNKRDNNGETPLYGASYYGRLEVVRALLAAGADVNKSSRWGDTRLLRASERG